MWYFHGLSDEGGVICVVCLQHPVDLGFYGFLLCYTFIIDTSCRAVITRAKVSADQLVVAAHRPL